LERRGGEGANTLSQRKTAACVSPLYDLTNPTIPSRTTENLGFSCGRVRGRVGRVRGAFALTVRQLPTRKEKAIYRVRRPAAVDLSAVPWPAWVTRDGSETRRVRRVRHTQTAFNSGARRTTPRTDRRSRIMNSSPASASRTGSASSSGRSAGTRTVRWISSITTVLVRAIVLAPAGGDGPAHQINSQITSEAMKYDM